MSIISGRGGNSKKVYEECFECVWPNQTHTHTTLIHSEIVLKCKNVIIVDTPML